LPIKHTDKRARAFILQRGEDCAEVDALPPSELRARVERVIETHIDKARWKQLQKIEQAEQKTIAAVVNGWSNEKLTRFAFMSPTARSLAHLRRPSYVANVVERWLPHAGVGPVHGSRVTKVEST
jgi:hypothetical protein